MDKIQVVMAQAANVEIGLLELVVAVVVLAQFLIVEMNNENDSKEGIIFFINAFFLNFKMKI